MVTTGIQMTNPAAVVSASEAEDTINFTENILKVLNRDQRTALTINRNFDSRNNRRDTKSLGKVFCREKKVLDSSSSSSSSSSPLKISSNSVVSGLIKKIRNNNWGCKKKRRISFHSYFTESKFN